MHAIKGGGPPPQHELNLAFIKKSFKERAEELRQMRTNFTGQADLLTKMYVKQQSDMETFKD